MFTDWKTTITGIVTGIAVIAGHFGLNIDPTIQSIIIAIGVALIGFFAKDNK
jgi:hypothetical protein